MAAHVHLKNEFTEYEKYHNLMTWLASFFLMNVLKFNDFVSLQERERAGGTETTERKRAV